MSNVKRSPGYYDGSGNQPNDAQLHAHGIFPGTSRLARQGPARTQAEAIGILNGIVRLTEADGDSLSIGAIRLELADALAYFGDRSLAPTHGAIFRDGGWVSPPEGWTAHDAAMEHARRTNHIWWFDYDNEAYCQECGEFWKDEHLKKWPPRPKASDK